MNSQNQRSIGQNRSSISRNRRPQKGMANHTNFIEALKTAGGTIASDTSRGFKEDLIKGSAKQMVNTIFNTNQKPAQTPEQNPDFNFSEYLKSSEKRVKSQERVKYEYEQSETVIFNRRQEEVNKKIESIRIELKGLAKEVVQLDQATLTAIEQEITDPGTYHLNFFEKLLSFLKHMRKRVVESRHWASLQSQRSKTKSYYWKMSGKKVGGTKFMLSHERAIATQTG